MPVVKEPQAEPIPGYRLIEPLGSGGFGEVWKCEAPGGLVKAIKFVYGNMNGLEADRCQAEEELRAIQRIKTIRHPFLLSMDRVECVEGELMIVSELADRNLFDVFLDFQKQGLVGIPRGELLGYLAEAAEVLDLMNIEYQLQHLDIKPRNLFLVRKHVKVADFGLVNSMGGGSVGVSLGAITPLYASPEVFQGYISPNSDQYSLAIVYMELLSGKLPFAGKNSRQLLMQHCAVEPDLSCLPETDRAIVSRALTKDPQKRFQSCSELITALGKAKPGSSGPNATTDPAVALPAGGGKDNQATSSPNTNTVMSGADTIRQRLGTPLPTFPGFRFLESLGTNMLYDAWKVEDESGQPRVLRFLYGIAGRDTRSPDDGVVRLKALHHPGLWPCTIIDQERGRLALVNEVPTTTLKDRFQECVAQGQVGLPRRELLGYLSAAAEVIDYLYAQHGLHHLNLQPRLLVLAAGRLQVADFGLAHLLLAPAGHQVALQNARYAAPELFERHLSRTVDQYSLALIYQKLLTGTYPFRGPAHQARSKVPADVSRLPESDRAIIARALDPEPSKRWPSSLELIAALENALPTGVEPKPAGRDGFADLVAQPTGAPAPAHSPEAAIALNDIIGKLLASVAGAGEAEVSGELAARAGELQHKFRAGLPVGAARLKLDACRAQWYGQPIRDEGNTYVFHVSLPSNFWQQWIGRQPGLEVHILLARPNALTATPIDVTVTIRPFRCNKKRMAKLIEELGKPILDSVRKCLLVNAEKRTQDRLLWPYPLTVNPVLADGQQGPAIDCRGKDISLTGMGFYLPHELPTSRICIRLPSTGAKNLSLPATLVRAKRCADGWYEVGALFSLSQLKQSLHQDV